MIFCTSHNIKYYDTYEDRQLTFTKIIEDLIIIIFVKR